MWKQFTALEYDVIYIFFLAVLTIYLMTLLEEYSEEEKDRDKIHQISFFFLNLKIKISKKTFFNNNVDWIHQHKYFQSIFFLIKNWPWCILPLLQFNHRRQSQILLPLLCILVPSNLTFWSCFGRFLLWEIQNHFLLDNGIGHWTNCIGNWGYSWCPQRPHFWNWTCTHCNWRWSHQILC